MVAESDNIKAWGDEPQAFFDSIVGAESGSF